MFQNALDEYIRAIEFYDKREYKDSILYAAKSYESTLKVICGKTREQADGLTKEFVRSKYINDIPLQVSREGLRTNVLSSLPYLRNQLKVGHGEGGENILITPSLAKLILNLSATLNSFIVEQYKSYLPSPSNA
ncbi:hypothetical protein SDC9_185341 [bioreactor metagenome]|uniref:DUF7014 domain-containing protein n=1 Tax=bioreactor metagenome TaxID=1076179 RepID=A0A645HGG4_9ZZZZ